MYVSQIVLSWLQGVVIGVGEMSEFGSVFKMMQTEEVRQRTLVSPAYLIDRGSLSIQCWFSFEVG